MAKPAQWAQDLKNSDSIPQQRSFVRRIPAATMGAVSGETSAYASPTMAAPASYPSRMTGSGFDGVTQPGKTAGQVEEGEGVLNRNAMQAMTPDEFTAFAKAAQSGSIDKNLFRQSIGMPTMRSYATGGIVDPYDRSRGVPDTTATATTRTEPTPATSLTVPSVTREQPQIEPIQVRPITTPASTTITAPTVQRSKPTTSSTLQTAAAAGAPTVASPAPTETPDTYTVRPVTRDTQVNVPPIQVAPITAPTATTPITTTPATTTAEQPQTATSAYSADTVRRGLQAIRDQMNGMSEADRRIANYYLTNFDATNAADLRVLEHQISADPYMSDQAKQAAIAGMQREVSASRSTLSGQLATNAADKASAAAQNAVTLGQQVRTYEDITLPAAKQNMDILQRTFEEITLPESKINIEQLQSQLGSSNWNEIQAMIDSGASMERVNAKLTEKGLTPLSTAEFSSMLNAGTLGQQNWNRQLTAANMLLSTPGESNKTAAAAVYQNLFPGVDFDFSELVSMENSERFSTGLSQMASYVTTGADFDEVLTAMQKDGTLDKMGMDESQAAQLYNSMRINSIDAEWDEYSNSDFFKGLSPDEQAEASEFFKAKTLGNLDYDTLHEYEIYNPDGSLNMTVYAKTSLEADKKAASLGADYTVKDTGKVKFQMASTLTSESATTTKTPTASTEGQGSDKPVGTRYIEDGRVYQVGAGSEIKELKIDPSTEQWTKTADDILALGEEGNPYYKSIMESRAKDIIDGVHEVTGKIEDPALLSEVTSSAEKWTQKFSRDESGYATFTNAPEDGSIIKLTGVSINGEDYENQAYVVVDNDVNPGKKGAYRQNMKLMNLKTGEYVYLQAAGTALIDSPDFSAG